MFSPADAYLFRNLLHFWEKLTYCIPSNAYILTPFFRKQCLFGTWLGTIRITWGKSPERLFRYLRFSKRATVGVLATYATRWNSGMKRVKCGWTQPLFHKVSNHRFSGRNYLGSADSPLCSPPQSGWRSLSEGVDSPPSGPQVESVHKSAQLIWAASLPYWHGWLYRHDLPKTCQNAECRRPPTFWPFFQRKVKILTRLISVLSLPFKFV